MTAVLIILILTAIIMAGTALAYVAGGAATLAFLASGHGEFLAVLPQKVFSQLNVFAFMAMPLFILVGEVMNRGGITTALVDFAMSLVGRVKGGLGYVNILTSLFFSGISGAAMADAAAVSNTLVPTMRQRGYSTEYASALTCAASIIGPIIPPSIVMIFYGAIMGVDVAALFAGGIGPGLLLTGVLMAANFFFAHRHNHPGGTSADRKPVIPTLRRAAPALLLPIIIMAGIVFGWMTPTEAAAVAVIVAIVIGFSFRLLNGRELWRSAERTVILSGAIFVGLAAASGISFLATLTQFPAHITDYLTTLGVDATTYSLLLTLVFFILGMVFDVQIALALIIPVLAPIAVNYGIHPVHLGVMICVNLSMGLITPPLGGVMMVVSSIVGMGYWRLVKAVLPFLLIEVAVLLVIVLVPEVTLAIPRYLGLL